LTRSRLEPTIYRTGGKHAIYYTTDAISTKGGENISKERDDSIKKKTSNGTNATVNQILIRV